VLWCREKLLREGHPDVYAIVAMAHNDIAVENSATLSVMKIDNAAENRNVRLKPRLHQATCCRQQATC